MKSRKITEEDYPIIAEWWTKWGWPVIPQDKLPGNGTSGIIITTENDKPIVAGFIYFTNSTGAFLEWVVSDPEYLNEDRATAISALITSAELVCKDAGSKYIISIGRNKSLMQKHKELGWHVDNKPSHEMTKILK
tara:strand:- start:7444 stop:7848 length:405 start_codon:yes stop_codon:yes gene_type:complete